MRASSKTITLVLPVFLGSSNTRTRMLPFPSASKTLSSLTLLSRNRRTLSTPEMERWNRSCRSGYWLLQSSCKKKLSSNYDLERFSKAFLFKSKGSFFYVSFGFRNFFYKCFMECWNFSRRFLGRLFSVILPFSLNSR